MYVYISIMAYLVVLFLTLRDIRIFRRTSIMSYRKGALKGILSSFVMLIGVILTVIKPELGLLVVFIGLYINRKGQRELVFKQANTLDRLLGKTDI
jgi:CHASE2 domain-containing sensor protein